MSVEIRKPDFFIVGAPKCGTTAMVAYLAQHPEIYMAEDKECHHFATDLLPADDPFRSIDLYTKLFERAQAEAVVGESSVLYLYSKAAPENIHEFNDRAKIIIQLRNPVDVLISYHSQLLYNGDEDITDLREALAAEADRRRGERISVKVRFVHRFYYSELFAFSDQIERYFRRFGREQTHVVVYDDFRADTACCYRKTLEFLGVDQEFLPEFPVINTNKTVRSKALRNVMKRSPDWLLVPIKFALPREKRRILKRRLKSLNTRYEPRAPLDLEFRRELQERFRPDVERLSELLDRDLTRWTVD